MDIIRSVAALTMRTLGRGRRIATESKGDRSIDSVFSLLLFLSIVTIAALPAYLHLPSDFAFYHHAARHWQDIYTLDVPHFFYFPWALAIVAPFSILRVKAAWALYNVSGIISIWLGLNLVCRRASGKAFALLRFPVAVLLFLGQWDSWHVGITLLAVWGVRKQQPEITGIALMLLTAKPHTTLPVIVLLIIEIFKWPVAHRARMFGAAASVLLASFCLWGWWVPRYWAFIHLDPPETMEAIEFASMTLSTGLDVPWSTRSTAAAILLASLYRIRTASIEARTAFAMVLGVVLWPYANIYNYTSSAIAIAWLYGQKPGLGIAACLIELVSFAVVLADGPNCAPMLAWASMAWYSSAQIRRGYLADTPV